MPTTAELFRLLCNLIRTGTVTALDEDARTARVSTGENVTDWVRWATSRAGDAVIWHAPSVGEQVIILAPCGEMTTAMIIGSLYSNDHPAPAAGIKSGVITWPDGAAFSYDPESSTLSLSGIKALTVKDDGPVEIHCRTAEVKADKSITLNTPNVICTEKLTAGTLSITQGGELNGDFIGAMTINGVKPHDHEHGGVEHGGSWTEGTK
ncbi:phage baseplate assembly protein V [Pantoea agglomerans]|uniref:phage baseplate assembly protein V n=1 Tax=Enterobacter agglomerans TaxID=549 RepID=UPI001781ACAA|nr:phage baseplate assembly protein V [Pantoea agglomerans]WVL84750.1 phage baseplate assembly protein V [Pantoea agglomerans]